MAGTSWMNELRKITCEIGTSSVSSSIAASSLSVFTCTASSFATICTRAPLARWASQKYITDGKFRSV